MTTIYEQLEEHRDQPQLLLDGLVDYLRENRRAIELFEAIKMRTRGKLGLPLITIGDQPQCSAAMEAQLEAGLLDACREAGTMLIEDGQVGQGWMYLRPTGDLETARRLISKIPIDDANHDEMVQVLLHEGVDLQRGYAAVLKRQGTCNSITLYQQAIVSRSKSDRIAAAVLLLDHLYNELCEAVRGDISRRSAPADAGESLLQMIDKRPELLTGGGYHIDTTHIASVVQIARVISDPLQLEKAFELTQYGRRLHPQFQYPGEEPWVDFYPAHSAFYSVLLGKDVDAGLEYFRRKAESIDPLQHGTAAIEAYVDLLDRTGNSSKAIAAATSLVPDDVPPQRILPILVEIADHAGNPTEVIRPIAEYCRRRGDLLGYAAVMANQNG